MHSAVLQNDKYIDFANENTVEVIALQDLQKGLEAGDRKADQYDDVDEEGNPVKYMVEYPGLTLEEMYALHRSKAPSYNDTGGIPYTAIVDPHTEKQMRGLSGGKSAGQLMEVIEEMRKKLEEEYGEGLSRKDLNELKEAKVEAREVLADKGVGRALTQFDKDTKKLLKKGDKLVAMIEAHKATLLEKASEELDKAEELIDVGDYSDAQKIMSSLKAGVKKTDLEKRIEELYDKIKAKKAEDKK